MKWPKLSNQSGVEAARKMLYSFITGTTSTTDAAPDTGAETDADAVSDSDSDNNGDEVDGKQEVQLVELSDQGSKSSSQPPRSSPRKANKAAMVHKKVNKENAELLLQLKKLETENAELKRREGDKVKEVLKSIIPDASDRGKIASKSKSKRTKPRAARNLSLSLHKSGSARARDKSDSDASTSSSDSESSFYSDSSSSSTFSSSSTDSDRNSKKHRRHRRHRRDRGDGGDHERHAKHFLTKTIGRDGCVVWINRITAKIMASGNRFDMRSVHECEMIADAIDALLSSGAKPSWDGVEILVTRLMGLVHVLHTNDWSLMLAIQHRVGNTSTLPLSTRRIAKLVKLGTAMKQFSSNGAASSASNRRAYTPTVPSNSSSAGAGTGRFGKSKVSDASAASGSKSSSNTHGVTASVGGNSTSQ